MEGVNFDVRVYFSYEAVCAERRKSPGLCQKIAKVSILTWSYFSRFSNSFILLPTAIDSFSYSLPILRTVGTSVNGPLTGIVRGNPHKEPSPKQEAKPKGRVQRSKSFPWEGPPSLELPQQAMPSFEEQDKESPIEVCRIFHYKL